MNQEQAPRHRYVVEALRRVSLSGGICGPFRHSYRRVEFGFGKGQPYATGGAALEAATTLAQELLPAANEVAVWKYNGYKGTQVSQAKQAAELLLPDWAPEPAAPAAQERTQGMTP